MIAEPYRVKLVTDTGPDAHFWHRATFKDALEARDVLLAQIPAEVEPRVFVYVETDLGHVRVA